MTQAAEIEDDMRERRCVVSGEVLTERELVRFAADPDGNVVPDIAATLPGRGMWVTATKKALETAIAKNAFSKAAKAPVKAQANLADTVIRQLIVRMQGDLGIARKAGAIVMGFDSVMRAFATKQPPSLADIGLVTERAWLQFPEILRGWQP